MNLTTSSNYIFKVCVVVSLFLNVVTGGRMYESLCARAWRNRKWKWGYWHRSTVRLMDWLEPNHCRKAYQFHTTMMKRGAIK